MMAQRGFTLIEALVAGTIGALLPAVLLVVMRVGNGQLASNAVAMRLSQIGDVVNEDIRRTAMASTWVYDVNEAGGACTGATPPANQLDLDGVVFCNSALNVLKGYQVVADADGDHGTLQELVNGAWADMTVGGSPVKVTFNPGQPAGGKRTGLFGVWNNAHFLWWNLRFEISQDGNWYALPFQTESAVCRNAPEPMKTW